MYLKALFLIWLCSSVYASTLRGELVRQRIKNLVTFGDSYTDVVNTGDNGTAWSVYAAGYGSFNLFPFAKSGATCSNKLTNRPAPSLLESQLPTYFSVVDNGSLETVYTLWIGTNDLGRAALLTGDQEPGVSSIEIIDCAVSWVTTLYKNGGRNFLFQNLIPLQNTILYSNNTYINHYWTYPHNATEWSLFMTELTTVGNSLSRLMLRDLVSSLQEAHIGIFDSYGLFSDMISNPSAYLNGTAPLSVTTPIKSCVYVLNENVNDTGNCTIVTGSDRDSFLWYDELHPSEQADRVVAREVTKAILRVSGRWVDWLS